MAGYRTAVSKSWAGSCAGDCLVLNDTKVLPARFFAQRQTGALLEGLFLSEQAGTSDTWEVMLKGARKVKPGERIRILDTTKRMPLRS